MVIRAARDLLADVACVLLAAAGGAVLLLVTTTGPGAPRPLLGLDLGIGAVSWAGIWYRRRWPAGLAVLTLFTAVISLSSGAASLIAVCNAGIRCRPKVAVALAVAHELTMIPYYLLWATRYPVWGAAALSLAEYGAMLTLGLYIRAPRHVDLDMRVASPEEAPGPLGRDTYRIVREALANVSKHARGTAATVSVAGSPGEGLLVTVRNKLPLTRHGSAALPGAGLGLVGLADIAARLYMSEATVKAHVSRVLVKLGLSNRVQVAIMTRDAGL